MKTSTVNKLSIPFGIFIGPATFVSNLIKVIRDIVKLAHTIFLIWKHKPTAEIIDRLEEYESLRKSVEKTQQERTANPRPITDTEDLQDLDWHLRQVSDKKIYDDSKIYEEYQELREKIWTVDLPKHLSYIGISVIRSVPLVGGISLTIYDAVKISSP